MKIKYEKPVAIFDEFAANQFIASCEQIITDNKAGMNCVNPNHYDLPWNKKHLKYSSSESNEYHKALCKAETTYGIYYRAVQRR